MLWIFAGEDTFASYHAAQKQVQKLAGGRDVETIDAEDTTLNQIQQKLDSIDLFSAQGPMWLKRVDKNKTTWQWITGLDPKALSRDVVVWCEGKLDGRAAVTKKLAGEHLQVFEALKPRQFTQWTQQHAHTLGIKLNSDLAGALVEVVGADKWLLDQELQKLATFVSSGGQLSVQLIREVSTTEISGDIWRFLDLLTAGNRQAAIAELHKVMFYDAEQIHYVIAMLTRELDLLAKVLTARKLGLSMGETGLQGFVLDKTVAKAGRFSLEKVSKLIQGLFRLEVGIKSGKIFDPEAALMLYCLSW